ncbi:MAG: hypothetical protein GXO76_02940 [Calditrichaeota bacterium]|nr:hypothetical protein [Calditrichota bacterium]
MKKIIRRVGIAVLLLVLMSAVSMAQQKTKQKQGKTTKSKTAGISQEAKKLFLDKIEIKGWIAKPQMVYIIPGTDPKVDDIVIDRSFIDEIMKPLDKDTFERKYNKKQEMLIPW